LTHFDPLDPSQPSNFHILQIQDDSGSHLENNRHISATLWPIAAKFGTVTHFGKAWRATAGLCHVFLV